MVKAWLRKWLLGGNERLGSYPSNWLYDMISAGGTSSAGVTVTPESSMQLTAVYSCVRLLAETVAQLPMQTYRRRRDGSKEWLPDYPLQVTLAREPNDWQTSFEFREMMQGHLVTRGNAYARIIAGDRGAVTQLIPLHPGRMRPERMANGRLRFEYTTPDGRKETYLQDELFRLCGLSSDGISGLNPIELERDAIGGLKATETYGNKFFANSAKPGGFLTTDGPMKEEAAKQNRKMWEDVHRGADNAFRTAVLTDGLKWQAVGIDNEAAQFLESKKFGVVEICRIFRVPPHLVYDLERATFSNIEEQSLEFAIYTMLPWLRRWEEAISRDLIVEPDVYVKFNMEGLLRGSAQARAALYQQALTSGWMSINEVRELEDMDPIADGDAHFIQGAMIPLEVALNPPTTTEPARPAPDDTEDEQEQMATVMIAALERNQAVYTDAIQKAHETTQLTVSAVQESVLAGLKSNQELAAMQLKDATERIEALQQERLTAAAAIAKAELNGEQLAGQNAELQNIVSELSLKTDRQGEAIQSAKAIAADLIAERVHRMVRIEVKQAAELAKNSKVFLDAADKFYQEHAAKFIEALEIPMALASTLGIVQVEYEPMVRSYLDESRRQLESIYDTATPDIFQSVVLDTANDWPDRAKRDLGILWTFDTEHDGEHTEDQN